MPGAVCRAMEFACDADPGSESVMPVILGDQVNDFVCVTGISVGVVVVLPVAATETVYGMPTVMPDRWEIVQLVVLVVLVGGIQEMDE